MKIKIIKRLDTKNTNNTMQKLEQQINFWIICYLPICQLLFAIWPLYAQLSQLSVQPIDLVVNKKEKKEKGFIMRVL